jgi:hypothetical protein
MIRPSRARLISTRDLYLRGNRIKTPTGTELCEIAFVSFGIGLTKITKLFSE